MTKLTDEEAYEDLKSANRTMVARHNENFERIEELENRSKRDRRRLDDHRDRIEDLEESHTSWCDGAAKTEARVEDQGKILTDALKRLESLDGRVTHAEGEETVLARRVDSQDEFHRQVMGRMDKVLSRMNQVEGKLDGVEAGESDRMSKLEVEDGELSERIKAVEAGRLGARDDREDLRELYTGLRERLANLDGLYKRLEKKAPKPITKFFREPEFLDRLEKLEERLGAVECINIVALAKRITQLELHEHSADPTLIAQGRYRVKDSPLPEMVVEQEPDIDEVEVLQRQVTTLAGKYKKLEERDRALDNNLVDRLVFLEGFAKGATERLDTLEGRADASARWDGEIAHRVRVLEEVEPKKKEPNPFAIHTGPAPKVLATYEQVTRAFKLCQSYWDRSELTPGGQAWNIAKALGVKMGDRPELVSNASGALEERVVRKDTQDMSTSEVIAQHAHAQKILSRWQDGNPDQLSIPEVMTDVANALGVKS